MTVTQQDLALLDTDALQRYVSLADGLIALGTKISSSIVSELKTEPALVLARQELQKRGQ